MNPKAGTNPTSPPMAQLYREHIGWLLLVLLLTYLALIAGGALLLHGPNVREGGEPLQADRALFLSVSAATLTGFQQTVGFNEFKSDNALGPAILLILTIAGSLFAMIAGGLAGVRVLRLPFSDLKVIAAALIVELLAVLVGMAALLTHGVHGMDAVQQAASAFGNSGAVITAKDHRFPPFNSGLTQLVLLPLSVFGGLGLPVLMELYFRLAGEIPRLSRHSLTVLGLTAGVYLAATLLLFISARMHSAAASDTSEAPSMTIHPNYDGSWRGSFLAASTTALNTRTAGLPFDILDYFPEPAQWLLVLLMMIGASPAGTGGGLKITTLYLLFIGFRNVLRGQSVGRNFGIAGTWVGVYLLLAAASFVCLCSVKTSLSASEGAFLTISALSNVGLSHDPIAGPGMYLLAVVMLLGRLAPLGVLWWMAKTTPAEVLVG